MTKPKKDNPVPREPETKRYASGRENGHIAALLRYPRGGRPLERGIIHWK
jgi:hypothetical protein